MRRLVSLVIGVPVALILVLFAVANRGSVVLSFDPFMPETPALAIEVPVFVVVLVSLMIGVLVGGIADWLRQGRYRREARARRSEVRRLEAENSRRAPSMPAGSRVPALRR